MKRALVKRALAVAPVKNKKDPPRKSVATKVVRLCTREGCKNTITPGQKKYCSHVCRNIGINANGNPGGIAVDKYLPEYATSKFEEYLKHCEKGHEPTLIPTESSYIVIQNAKMPTIEDYAVYLGVHVSTLKNWADRIIEFGLALDKMKAIQRTFLINNGLSGRYNSTISKLLLGTNHGLIERREVDNTHKLIGVVKHLYERADEMEKQLYGGEGRS